ncbi:hypothetical protein ACTMU2_20745 [Cupriavidus basilensis]
MRELGLSVSIDGISSIGRRAGRTRRPAPVAANRASTPSVLAAAMTATSGVLAGLEVMAALDDAGIVTRRPLAVFSSPTRKAPASLPDMMGSLVFRGDLPLEQALVTRGIDGTTVGENLDRIGYAGGAPVGPAACMRLSNCMEQGPVLEHGDIAISAVTGVQGVPWTGEFTVEGTSNRTGTTPMQLRRRRTRRSASPASCAT